MSQAELIARGGPPGLTSQWGVALAGLVALAAGALALPGNWLGMRLRPSFGLAR